jgi:acetyl-CoA C-acetyltransferase
MSDVVIVGAARTPIASFQGAFSGLSAHDLGAVAIRAALERSRLPPSAVNEVFMGNCLMAAQGQAPARQAAHKAGLPRSAGAVTLSKMCGSGMRAAMFGADMLHSGNADVIVAGGMESMTNAPHLLPRGRSGIRIGHDTLLDHLMFDGLEDAYEPGRTMGSFGEDCAERYGFPRHAQDDYARASVERARRAAEQGGFDDEIAAVSVRTRQGEASVARDEGPQKIDVAKIDKLKPAFKPGGTITAASSSGISDGAAALVLARESIAAEFGARPIARVVAQAVHAQEPGWFTTAPVFASRRVLSKANWSVEDVDLWEVNEAFAVVPMALMAELKVPHDRMNVNGGACALGHPIGASGARILVTLLHALRRRGLKRGVASLCIGGGEASAMAIELI